jgi:hypothetical protein
MFAGFSNCELMWAGERPACPPSFPKRLLLLSIFAPQQQSAGARGKKTAANAAAIFRSVTCQLLTANARFQPRRQLSKRASAMMAS